RSGPDRPRPGPPHRDLPPRGHPGPWPPRQPRRRHPPVQPARGDDALRVRDAAILAHPPRPPGGPGCQPATQVARVYRGRTAVAGGRPATADIINDDSVKAVRLRCRSPGAWGNDLTVDVQGIPDSTGKMARVTIRLLRAGVLVEEFDGLQISPDAPDDLFETI